MTHWLRRGADGWRLDAAYAVPDRFWAQVLPRVRQSSPDAWFVGEVIHGDYPAPCPRSAFDSVTQYELWKAIWSSLNDGNFHELDQALVRHNEFLDDVRADDVRRQSRRHPDRQPAGRTPVTSSTRWCSC